MSQNEQGFGKIVQLLGVLSQMQNSRRELDLREQSLAEQRSEFARSMGYNEKSEQFKAFQEFLKLSTDLPTDGRDKLGAAAKKAGLPQEMVDAVMMHPQSLQSILTALVQKGQASVDPREVASVATTGMNRGAAATSGLQAALATGAQSQVTPRLMQSFAEKAAGDKGDLQNAVEAGIVNNPKLLAQFIGIQAGNPTAYQSGELATAARNAATSEASVRASMIGREVDTAKDIMIAMLTKGHNAQQTLQAVRALQNQQRMIDNKNISPAERAKLMGDFNNMIDAFGIPGINKYNSPNDASQASLLDQLERSLGTYAQPGNNFAPASPGNAPGNPPMGGGGFNNSLQFPPPQNPMMQFLPRPPQ